MSEEIGQESRRRLMVFFKNQSEMVDAYVSQFGTDINMKNVQVIRDQFPGSGDAPAAETEDAPLSGDSLSSMNVIFKFNSKALSLPEEDAKMQAPLYPRTVDCPVCKKWGLNSQDLRAKSLTLENDPFLAPVYRTTGRWREVNYLCYCMSVCDVCLTASPDRKDFNVYNPTTRQNQFSQLPMSVVKDLNESKDLRKAFVEKTGISSDSLLKIPRTYAGAIVSYQLADIRAEIEANAKVMGAYYKRGNYWTRIALLCRQAGMKDEDKRALEIAVEHFKTAFIQSDFPKIELEFQTIYIIFSIFLFFGKQKEAMDYMNVLGKTLQDLEQGDPRNEALAHARKWQNMIRNRWDDRDYPEIWKTPGLS